MRPRLAVALIPAIFVIASGLSATQSISLTGVWALEASATETSDDNGNTTRLLALSGTLTLEQKADVVSGSWKGRLPTSWALTGRLDGNRFELQTETRDMPIESNGQRQQVPRHWIFRGTIDGKKLTGTMALAGGEGEPPMQPFSAQRQQ